MGEYTLSGMEYSDVFDEKEFLGIPEDLDVDKVISNPNLLFEYSEKIHILKDNSAYQIVTDTMPDLVSALNIFSEYKMFSSEEEMDSYIAISKDNDKKMKDTVLRIMAIHRAEEDYDGEYFIDSLEYDEEEFDQYNEEKEDEHGDIVTVNKFDTSKPYYTFEKEIIKMIDGLSDRYERIILNRHEYFDNIKKYKPVIMKILVNMARKDL